MAGSCGTSDTAADDDKLKNASNGKPKTELEQLRAALEATVIEKLVGVIFTVDPVKRPTVISLVTLLRQLN